MPLRVIVWEIPYIIRPVHYLTRILLLMMTRPALLLFAGCLLSLLSWGQSQTPNQPNIILIMADDLGFSDLGCYGSEIQTPNLDRLAREGLRMTQFYNTAKCTQSRAMMLSGLYHQQTDNLTRRDNNVTLAEVLRTAGYRTIMSGKWHLGNWESERDVPNNRGFDRYFGFLNGASNFFTGRDYGSDQNYMRLDTAVYEAPNDFYTTDQFTDFAIEEVAQAARQNRPFFLYLAHNAPHYPLQAPEENIEKYRGKYAMGWDSLRQKRYRRMQQLKIIDPRWPLSPRDTLAPAWASLKTAQQQKEQALMEVYAAMIDRLDQQIGRLLDQLDASGVADNTLIMFLSDNGGCPFDANRGPLKPPGPASSSRTYDTEWAQVSNTPFRRYKQWIHEGGIATPMIVRWPGEIDANTLSSVPGQILDLMPTLLEAAGAAYPRQFKDRTLLPAEGVSLLPSWRGDTLRRERPMFWEYEGSRAVREGDWKLVGERGRPWELYNLQEDRTEMDNQIDQNAQRARKMINEYNRWAQRTGGRTTEAAMQMPVNQQDRYLYEDEVRERP